MTIRFVLEVPEQLADDLVGMLDDAPEVEPLTARRVEGMSAENPIVEVNVVSEELDVVDRLYDWFEALDEQALVFLNLDQGDRYRLSAYDRESLRHALESDLEEALDTAPRARFALSRAGNSAAEIPYGGQMTDGSALVPARREVKLGQLDHIAVRVRDPMRAERFYQEFLGMNVIYRAYLEDGRWEQLDEAFDWEESIHTGVRPEIVRLENGPVAIVLIDVGGGKILHEKRIDHISITAPAATVAEIRGRTLFHSFTILEDTPVAFRFVDPFGVVWQIIADETS